ncbi:hypothetical protein [Rheinheimera pacifica]|uniref:hypothetical protein n=1 Tax=Rheinheimera pacifica TaxID=173990 RepID=UPI002EDB6D81
MGIENVTNAMTYTFTLMELVSLAIGLVSIVLGIFAIWLTLHLKRESETLNKETKALLLEIRTDAKSISHGVFSEMAKWGDAGRTALTSSAEERRSGGVGSNTAHPHSTNVA